MRLVAWLWVILAVPAALLSGACSGGYPLEPTRCDDWCDATQGAWDCVGEYDPAGCVTRCEAQQLDNPECSAQYDAAVHCHRTTPGATNLRCFYDPTTFMLLKPCHDETVLLMTCSGSYPQYGELDPIR
ncbi:MAG TPA: hypothetical protein VJN18_23910 [Polyangiaceae bacterium]|nr:hypothetical protein [Polyangiaceae bacterium]